MLRNGLRSAAAPILLLPALFWTHCLPAQAADQGAKHKAVHQAEPYAIVAGTVFRDPGFAQAGASVVLALKSAPTKKLQQQTSSPRGEFSFRVPPGPKTYLVTATLKGFQAAREEIEIQGQEQINATLLLVPESKKRGR
jgi:Carboxypeptidase regulatory-like domain